MWLSVLGFSVFGTVYLGSIPLTAAIASGGGSKFAMSHAGVMAIPFAGPWLEAAGVVESESSSGAPGLAVLGVLQVVGATLGIIGSVGCERIRPVAADAPKESTWELEPSFTFGPSGAPEGAIVSVTLQL